MLNVSAQVADGRAHAVGLHDGERPSVLVSERRQARRHDRGRAHARPALSRLPRRDERRRVGRAACRPTRLSSARIRSCATRAASSRRFTTRSGTRCCASLPRPARRSRCRATSCVKRQRSPTPTTSDCTPTSRRATTTSCIRASNSAARPPQYAQDAGWTGSHVWHAHCVKLDDSGIDVFARTGTGVAHCPSSNMRLASGIAPVRRMLDAGVAGRPRGRRLGVERFVASSCRGAPGTSPAARELAVRRRSRRATRSTSQRAAVRAFSGGTTSVNSRRAWRRTSSRSISTTSRSPARSTILSRRSCSVHRRAPGCR